MQKSFYVYIMSNSRRTVLYIGITNSLERRYIEHSFKKNRNSFTFRYNICDLLYYEEYSSSLDVIAREKQLKRWGRTKKMNLIEQENPYLENLFKISRDSSAPFSRPE